MSDTKTATTNMVGLDEIRAGLKKAAEGVKKAPGLMKSSVGYIDLVSTYVERIATAHDEGKWVAAHGTQQPLEIFEAMDVRGIFNEFWGVVLNLTNNDSVPEALSVSASTGIRFPVRVMTHPISALQDRQAEVGLWILMSVPPPHDVLL